MIVRLKTIEQLIEEFGFEYNGYEYYTTTFDKMHWCISKTMLKQLGDEIEVEKFYEYNNYTHIDNRIRYLWHELWFEPKFVPIEFINEKEFEII